MAELGIVAVSVAPFDVAAVGAVVVAAVPGGMSESAARPSALSGEIAYVAPLSVSGNGISRSLRDASGPSGPSASSSCSTMRRASTSLGTLGLRVNVTVEAQPGRTRVDSCQTGSTPPQKHAGLEKTMDLQWIFCPENYERR